MAITLEEIAAIKELQAQGFGPYQISAQVGADPKTVRKYMKQDDFSPAVPQLKSSCGKLTPWIPTICVWLEEDQQNRHKQRHTAKRIYDRLVKEDPAFSCSYRTVSRYVAEWKAERRQGHGAQELVWHPGECQADFGECDMYVRGSRVVVKYLVVTFPYSNVGYLQCFHGETAECLCQGLKDIFHYIGGVPQRVVIDNATGAGRRMGEVIRLTELFQRFKAHYGFSLTFCNPRSGNEKGNVENKVGYFRRNILVPIPKTESLEHFNAQVLEECELDNCRDHYKLNIPMCELFQEDKQQLLHLPELPFECCKYRRLSTDHYGKFCIDNCHFYNIGPQYADSELWVRIGAFVVEPLDSKNRVISSFERQFGGKRTDTGDWLLMLGDLARKPGAWHNSQVRENIPCPLRDYLDEMDKAGLRQVMTQMQELAGRYDFDIALNAVEQMLTRRSQGEEVGAEYLAGLMSMGIQHANDAGLERYDELLKEEVC